MEGAEKYVQKIIKVDKRFKILSDVQFINRAQCGRGPKNN